MKYSRNDIQGVMVFADCFVVIREQLSVRMYREKDIVIRENKGYGSMGTYDYSLGWMGPWRI